jgi:glycosyltransferase involved in cell wall biosynthesis
MIKVSIVIPAYNRKFHLKNTLLALNHQEGWGRDDFEVILVDDGSTDNTREYLQGVNKNYDLKYIYLEKGALPCYARARNTGWKSAAGAIIIFLDSDMIVRSDYLNETFRCFAMDENIILITTRLLLPEGSVVEEREVTDGSIFERIRFDKEKMNYLEIRHIVFNQMSYNMSMDPASWLFIFSCSITLTKKSLIAIDGFDENFFGWGVEDIDLGYKTYQHKIKLVYDYKLEGVHQYHKESSREYFHKNMRYLLSKHPEMQTMLPKKSFDNMVKYTETTEQELVKKILAGGGQAEEERISDSPVPVLTVKDSQGELDVKEKVAAAVNDRNRVLVVLDFAEDSDLHIWIQLATYRSPCRVLYFPMSRKFDR